MAPKGASGPGGSLTRWTDSEGNANYIPELGETDVVTRRRRSSGPTASRNFAILKDGKLVIVAGD